MNILIITVAYLMDLVFGDPRWLPHPVKIIGKAIEKLEKPLRKICQPSGAPDLPMAGVQVGRGREKLAGFLLALIIILGTYFIVFGIIKFTLEINKFSGYLLSIIFIWTSLSIKDLAKESMLVYNCLKNNDIVKARKNLSMVVGRDTDSLDKPEIIRATVETTAEGFLDGVVSPLFYVFVCTQFFGMVCGTSLVLTYKAINTLDSMVGYKNDKYINFGYISAKIDGIVNFIPARLSAIFLSIGSTIYGRDGKKAFKLAFKDGIKNIDSNSEFPESSLAGAISLRLGGANYYKSVLSVKPYLGDSLCRATGTLEDIKSSIWIMYISSFIALVCGIIFCLLLY